MPDKPTDTANPPFASVPGSPACARCGQPFEPKPTRLKITTMTTCCETCQCKNFFDGLDLPTPPSLLDRHTKHPTLSDREWREKLNQQNDKLSDDAPAFAPAPGSAAVESGKSFKSTETLNETRKNKPC